MCHTAELIFEKLSRRHICKVAIAGSVGDQVDSSRLGCDDLDQVWKTERVGLQNFIATTMNMPKLLQPLPKQPMSAALGTRTVRSPEANTPFAGIPKMAKHTPWDSATAGSSPVSSDDSAPASPWDCANLQRIYESRRADSL